MAPNIPHNKDISVLKMYVVHGSKETIANRELVYCWQTYPVKENASIFNEFAFQIYGATTPDNGPASTASERVLNNDLFGTIS